MWAMASPSLLSTHVGANESSPTLWIFVPRAIKGRKLQFLQEGIDRKERNCHLRAMSCPIQGRIEVRVWCISTRQDDSLEKVSGGDDFPIAKPIWNSRISVTRAKEWWERKVRVGWLVCEARMVWVNSSVHNANNYILPSMHCATWFVPCPAWEVHIVICMCSGCIHCLWLLHKPNLWQVA